jgi:hypothetical protein
MQRVVASHRGVDPCQRDGGQAPCLGGDWCSPYQGVDWVAHDEGGAIPTPTRESLRPSFEHGFSVSMHGFFNGLFHYYNLEL